MIKETNFEFKLDYLCIAIVATAMLVAGIVPIIGKAATFIGVHYGTPLNMAQHKRPVYGDDEGREYDYYLTIEAAHFEAFVSLLMRRCQVKEEVPQTSKELLLLGLLDRLVVQEALGSSDTIKASLDTLTSWLGQERIPYQQFLL